MLSLLDEKEELLYAKACLRVLGGVMNAADKFALVPKSPSALEKATVGGNRVLAGMVQDALTLARTKVQRQDIPTQAPNSSEELENWFHWHPIAGKIRP